MTMSPRPLSAAASLAASLSSELEHPCDPLRTDSDSEHISIAHRHWRTSVAIAPAEQANCRLVKRQQVRRTKRKLCLSRPARLGSVRPLALGSSDFALVPVLRVIPTSIAPAKRNGSAPRLTLAPNNIVLQFSGALLLLRAQLRAAWARLINDMNFSGDTFIANFCAFRQSPRRVSGEVAQETRWRQVDLSAGDCQMCCPRARRVLSRGHTILFSSRPVSSRPVSSCLVVPHMRLHVYTHCLIDPIDHRCNCRRRRRRRGRGTNKCCRRPSR